MISQRRELLKDLREIVADKKTTEAAVQRLIGRSHWIFGGEYTETADRRDLMPLGQHDILLVRADRSVHVVELKRPGARLVKVQGANLVMSADVHDAVSQCRGYVQMMDDAGPTLDRIHRDALGQDYDYRRAEGTVVIGNPDHVEISGVAAETVATAVRSFNVGQSRIRVLTYLDLIKRAEEALRFTEDELESS
ncbi:DUF4263 domain-containing protein [Umezawaea endophytica]|uniref:DUF4263 domain-containing protein n=1 Tax=Umezawaea endophytica TaxID=1654476 RepID=A0A9X2VG37_9PSEU|nr:DUF4263 domain-containing protein [Umezawaea endophytica]MCS7475812.1 DUF4263 domain-containing protein [Umezawaea endophytica]